MKVKVILIAALTLISLRGFAQLTLERGYELVQQGKIPESIAVFEQIAVKQPRNSEVYNALSQLYYRQSKYKQAYDAADKGLAISVKDDNLSISKAKAANNLGKFDEAIALMDACIARDAAFFLPYAVKANAYDGQNKLQLAIGLYSKSIQLDPEYARNYLDRGSDFASLSRYDQAIADYTKVISLAPNADRPYNMRGIAYYKQGKFPEAITDYSKAIELQNWYALANRGIVYQEQGNKEKAIADFKMSIEKLPDVSDGWYQLAVVYKKDGEYDAALQHIQKALSMDTDRPHYHAVYAGLLIQTYKYAEALNQADQIFKIDPQNPDGFILKSTALHSLKRYDEAVDLITKGISVYPDNYLMYMIRALVYDLQGKTALAAADNEKAKQLGTK